MKSQDNRQSPLNDTWEWFYIKSLAAAHTVVCLPPHRTSRTPLTISTLTGPQLPFHAGCQSRFPYVQRAHQLVYSRSEYVCLSYLHKNHTPFHGPAEVNHLFHGTDFLGHTVKPLGLPFLHLLRPCLSGGK